MDLTQANRSLHARLDIVEQTCDQVTVLQIHDDANAGSGPNKPLLRIYKHQAKSPANHIWAAIKTDDGGVNTTHIDLGADPGGYFNCDIRLVDGNMIIDFEGEEKVNMDVSYWTWPSYWKAGVYLQDNGEATAHFDELFEEDGSPQNRFPSVTITSPSNNTNFEPGTDITITADADDSDGTIALVEFFEGGTNKLGEDATVPYSFTWVDYQEGAYTITAKATDNEGGSRTSLSTNITVGVAVNVTSVSLAGADGALAVGGTTQLEAVFTPSNATNQFVEFESDDTSVATVSESGIVTAVSVGTATITVTSDEGGFTDTREIQVLAPSTETNWALGQRVTATGTADGANVPENLVDGDVGTRWSVQEFPQSATIDLGGTFTVNQTEVVCYEDRAYQYVIEGALTEDGAYKTLVDRSTNSTPGNAAAPIINEVDGTEARFLRITVSGADIYTGEWVSLTELRVFGQGEREVVFVNGVSLDLSSVTLLEGETQQLTATINPSNATNNAANFSSSDPSIASVDTNGLVTAVSEGTATITVTTEDGGFSATTEITVTRPLSALNGQNQIRIVPNPATSVVHIHGAEPYQTVSVFDQTGKIVLYQKVESLVSLDIRALKTGIYLVRLEGSEGVQSVKLIKR